MMFGGQSVMFVTVTKSNDPGYLGMADQTSSSGVTVDGCHFRPLSTDEIPPTRVGTELWKCTAPPDQNVLAAKLTGLVKVDGETYLIEGPIQPKYDLDGSVHHVTIVCKKQVG